MENTRQKTGGRQKGTPNKVNASMKIMLKAFYIGNFDAMQDAFDRVKPIEKLNFITKMMPYLCAKATPENNGGEWLPSDNMDTTWIDDYAIEASQDRMMRRECLRNNVFRSRAAMRNQDLRYIANHDEARKMNGMSEEARKHLLREDINEFQKKYGIRIDKPCIMEDVEANPMLFSKQFVKQRRTEQFSPNTQQKVHAYDNGTIELDSIDEETYADNEAENQCLNQTVGLVAEENHDRRMLEILYEYANSKTDNHTEETNDIQQNTQTFVNDQNQALIIHEDNGNQQEQVTTNNEDNSMKDECNINIHEDNNKLDSVQLNTTEDRNNHQPTDITDNTETNQDYITTKKIIVEDNSLVGNIEELNKVMMKIISENENNKEIQNKTNNPVVNKINKNQSNKQPFYTQFLKKRNKKHRYA